MSVGFVRYSRHFNTDRYFLHCLQLLSIPANKPEAGSNSALGQTQATNVNNSVSSRACAFHAGSSAEKSP